MIPFILRGVKLLGIDSAMCPMDERRLVWQRLATEHAAGSSLPKTVRSKEIAIGGLPHAFDTLLEGAARGRFVVKLSTG